MLLTPLQNPARVVGISGSPTGASRSGALLAAALERLGALGLHTQRVELRSLPGAELLAGQDQHPEIRAAIDAVQQADVLVVATPIYKAAYSGLLKVFLDVLPAEALREQIVLPLATGGSAAHFLALDYALKPVLAALGARQWLDTVYATDAQFHADSSSPRRPDAETLARLERSLLPLTRLWSPALGPALGQALSPGLTAPVPAAAHRVPPPLPASAARMPC